MYLTLNKNQNHFGNTSQNQHRRKSNHQLKPYYRNIDYLLVGDNNTVVTFTTVETIVVLSHEDTGSTTFLWTRFTKTFNFITINFVVFKNSEFDVLVLFFDFFWFGVSFLFTFFYTNNDVDLSNFYCNMEK